LLRQIIGDECGAGTDQLVPLYQRPPGRHHDMRRAKSD
jgi:hypothetical protein